MSAVALQTDQNALTLHFGLHYAWTAMSFLILPGQSDLRMELTCEGDVIIMPPTGSKSGQRNFGLIVQFGVWMQSDRNGFWL